MDDFDDEGGYYADEFSRIEEAIEADKTKRVDEKLRNKVEKNRVINPDYNAR